MGKGTHYPDTGRRAPIAATGIVFLLLAAGCGRDDVRPTRAQPGVVGQREWPQVTPVDTASANAVLMRAISLVGTPYRYGGNTPDGGFDCSGLVNYVYSDMLGLRLPRTTRELFAWQGPRIAPERLVAGDLCVGERSRQLTEQMADGGWNYMTDWSYLPAHVRGWLGVGYLDPNRP